VLAEGDLFHADSQAQREERAELLLTPQQFLRLVFWVLIISVLAAEAFGFDHSFVPAVTESSHRFLEDKGMSLVPVVLEASRTHATTLLYDAVHALVG
jgi:hypothetical protein